MHALLAALSPTDEERLAVAADNAADDHRQSVARVFQLMATLTRLNAIALELGQLPSADPLSLGQHFRQQLSTFTAVDTLAFVNPAGALTGVIRHGSDQWLVTRAEDSAQGRCHRAVATGWGEGQSFIDGRDPRQLPLHRRALEQRLPVWVGAHPSLLCTDDERVIAIAQGVWWGERPLGVVSCGLRIASLTQRLARCPSKGSWPRTDAAGEGDPSPVPRRPWPPTRPPTANGAGAMGFSADPLTQLPDGTFLLERLHRALENAENPADPTLLVLEVADIKQLNDHLGRAAGDQLLVDITRRLRAAVPADVALARLAGGEFALLLEDPEGSEAVLPLASALERQLSTPFELNGHSLLVRVHMGIASASTGKLRARELLARARSALASAKGRGTTRVVCRREHRSGETWRPGLAAELHRALDKGELRLDYQPIVCPRRRRPVSAEALVRWAHPQRGLLPPADFMPAAEDAGLMVALGQWVLTTACWERRRWGEAGWVDDAFTVSVNVAGSQLDRPQFEAELRETLAVTGLDPRQLRLEITETAIAVEVATAKDHLQALKATGVGLSIDDFGTGYSSLARLHQLPVDTLKIDRAFLDGVGHGSGHYRFLEGVVHMAQGLGLTVVVEGVESAEQHRLLATWGCLGQGFYYASPKTRPDFPLAMPVEPRIPAKTRLIDPPPPWKPRNTPHVLPLPTE
ncbi:MAG: putative bifunctional diguanylate cyclase/phosphodiesterase [Candidatus Competibacterales bacterium]